MKKYALLFVIGLVALSAHAQQTSSGPAFTWEETSYDFGDIQQGDKVEHTFVFTNTGNEPLIITNIQVTCGCTTPKGWRKDPILPGEKSEITVAFNSTGKSNKQNKVVTVVSNAEGNNKVSFTANVLTKELPN